MCSVHTEIRKNNAIPFEKSNLRPESALAPAGSRRFLLFDGFFVRDVFTAALALHFLGLGQRHFRLLELVRQVGALLFQLVELGRVFGGRVLFSCGLTKAKRWGDRVRCL